MVNRGNPVSKTRRLAGRMISGAEMVAALTVLSLGGCSSSTPAPPSAAMKRAELHFSLDQCQPLDANLYKCPAIDKPICSPDYNGTQVDCVRIGPKGSVFVEQAIM